MDYSDTDRSFSYEQSQVPLPITRSRGTLRAGADDKGTRVDWEASFELVDPAQEAQLVPMIDGYYRQTLDSLRNRVEQGKPSG